MIKVLPFKQSDTSRCGPAVIKMILGYYGIDVTEDEICLQCDHSYEKGCTDRGMQKAFKHYGFATKIKENSTFDEVEYWIKNHYPVIVDYFSGGESLGEMSDGHSGIILDINKENVYLLEPIKAEVLVISRHDFMRVWFDWRDEDYLTDFNNMVMRQMIIAYPNKLIDEKKVIAKRKKKKK